MMSKKLFAFPCAGGNAQNFNRIINNLSCESYSMEYRGHWTRYMEGLYSSMEECIYDLCQEIEIIVREADEILLLGHSMGAIVAYEVALRLLNRGLNVRTLFLLACMPPDEIRYENLDFKNDYEIKKFLNEIRHVPEKLLNSEFFENNLLPIIRNDFHILTDYIKMIRSDKKINVKIICVEGLVDPVVVGMDGWQKYTNGVFDCIKCDGNHFFLYDPRNISRIKDIISEQM